MENTYPKKFYADLVLWLEQWLNENVGKDPNKLPYDINLRMLTVLFIQTFYRHVKTLYRRGATRETAQIFEISDDSVSRAIKKDFN